MLRLKGKWLLIAVLLMFVVLSWGAFIQVFFQCDIYGHGRQYSSAPKWRFIGAAHDGQGPVPHFSYSGKSHAPRDCVKNPTGMLDYWAFGAVSIVEFFILNMVWFISRRAPGDESNWRQFRRYCWGWVILFQVWVATPFLMEIINKEVDHRDVRLFIIVASLLSLNLCTFLFLKIIRTVASLNHAVRKFIA